jgi:hypothetical protein
MASKAEQIINHFTNDGKLKARILKAIADNKGKNGSVDNVLNTFNLSPGTKGIVREIIQKVLAGHSPHSITAYYTPSANHAALAASAISQHIGVVTHIVQPH